MKARIFIQRDGKNYKIASIEYNPEDASIYLFIPNRKGTPGKAGKIKLTGQKFQVDIEDLKDDEDFDHFSVHGSGIEHTKLKQGKTINRSSWTPLLGLDRARHLWTLVLPDVNSIEQDQALRARDLKIDYPASMSGGVIDILATPKQQDINFNVEYYENNDRITTHVFGQAVWDVGEYRVFIFSRSSDKHLGSPERTLKISLPNDYVPFINLIAKDYIEGIVATLTYDKPSK